MYFMYFYILLIGCVTCFDLPPDWINPADIHNSRKVGDSIVDNFVSAEPDGLPSEEERKTATKNESCICPQMQQSPCNSYFRRLINLLLLKTSMKHYRIPEGEKRIVPIAFYFNSKNLEILRAYSSSDTYESFTWSDFDQAFSSLFEAPEITKPTDEPDGPRRDYSLFIIVSIVSSIIFIGFWLLLTSGSVFKTIWGILILNFCCALVWNLIKAYRLEKEKILRLHGIPKTETTWLEYLSPFASKSEEVPLFDNDPLFGIDFGQVVTESMFFWLHVLPIFGKQSGQMVANFYSSQNYFIQYLVQPFQWILNPVLLIIFLLLLAIVLVGFRIKLPMFTLDINNKAPQQHPPHITPQQHPPHITPQQHPPHITPQQQLFFSPAEVKKKDYPQGGWIKRNSQPGESKYKKWTRSDWTLSLVKNKDRSNQEAMSALVQNDFFPAGSSKSSQPLKQTRSEPLMTDVPEKSAKQRHIAITSSRKGPWHGSIVRYGFIQKRIVFLNKSRKEELQK